MEKFYSVSSFVTVHGQDLTGFGQSVMLPSDVGLAKIREGAAILPAAEFEECGFTAEELTGSGDPVEFEAKQRMAWRALAALRDNEGGN